MSTLSFIMGYEGGEISSLSEVAQGFCDLANEGGLVWKLQGSYGREMQRLIDAGVVVKTDGTWAVDGEVVNEIESAS